MKNNATYFCLLILFVIILHDYLKNLPMKTVFFKKPRKGIVRRLP